MPWSQFFLIVGGCALTIAAFRIIPLFVLKGRELPPKVEHALNFIPPAAFAALVANDLFNPATFARDFRMTIISLTASAVVAVVALKTKSLLWCIVAGVGVFALLYYWVL